MQTAESLAARSILNILRIIACRSKVQASQGANNALAEALPLPSARSSKRKK